MKKIIILAIAVSAYFSPANAMEAGMASAVGNAPMQTLQIHIATSTASSWSPLSPKYLLYAAAFGGIFYCTRKLGPLGFLRAVGSHIYKYVYGLVSLPRIAPVIDSMNIKVDDLGISAANTLQEIQAVAKKADHIKLTLIEQGNALYKKLEDTNKQLEKLDEIARNCGLIPEILTIVQEQKRMLADQDILIRQLHAKSGRKFSKKPGIRHRMFRKKLFA